MKHYFFAACLFISYTAFGQLRITPKEAYKHIGDSVQVCGNVDDAKYFFNGKGHVSLLEMGGIYPNNALTVIVPPELLNAFPKPPEEVYYKNQNMCFTGRPTLCDGKPRIVITLVAQMKEIK